MFTLIKQIIVESIKMKNSNSFALLFLLIAIMLLEQTQYVLSTVLFALSAAIWTVVFYCSHHKVKHTIKEKKKSITKDLEA